MDLLDMPKSELMDRRSSGFPSMNSSDGGNGYIGGLKMKSTLSSFAWNHSSNELRDAPLDGSAMDQSATSNATVASGSLKAFLRVGDTSLFSSSLPATFQNTFDMSEGTRKVVEAGETGWDEVLDSLEEMETRMIGNLLPDDDDDDELFTGRSADFHNSVCLPNSKDEAEDFDLFSSVGGLELDGGSQESYGKFMNINGGLDNHSSGPGSLIGEHPYGEHPSRTLLVRNIYTGVEDSELQALFQQYGDIRTLYTEACKLRGFVIVSYYDIRAARSAMRGLQTKLLWNRKLDIHFYIPKENPSNKDINQGTLVIFNLDASVSNNVLCQIFGAYGEVKEVRETPHKRHHKFIEFYDVRASEAALKALNKTEIAGKRIKVEPSRPGGARRSLMQMLSQELEQEEICGFWPQVGSPITNSPPGHPSHRGHAGSPVGSNGFMRGLTEPIGFGTIVHSVNKPSSDWATTAAVYSTSPNVGTIGSYLGQGGSVGRGSLTRPQLMWGNSNPEMWSRAVAGKPYHHHHHHHHPVVDLSSVERHLGPFGESPDTPFLGPGSYSPNGILVGNNAKDFSCGGYVVRNSMGLNNGGMTGIMSPQHRVHRFNFKTAGPVSPAFMVGVPDHGRSRRTDNSASQLDHQRQFRLDLDQIVQGQDNRTTLMIKNIPNKYTSEMLLATIDEKHCRMYNFLYLPIDFKNKCNVGYAFINMTSPSHIIPFYETFNGKKWEKFNSEKVASLAYARIQGKSALVAHFQNSSLMNEDKRCRPILFRSDGPEAGEEEPFPLWVNIQPKSGKDDDQGASGRGDFVKRPDIGDTTKDSCESK